MHIIPRTPRASISMAQAQRLVNGLTSGLRNHVAQPHVLTINDVVQWMYAHHENLAGKLELSAQDACTSVVGGVAVAESPHIATNPRHNFATFVVHTFCAWKFRAVFAL